MSHLLITVRFLDERYHGLLARGGPPEWPPSPFRLFCALVAGVARRGELDGDVGNALEWLQSLEPPIIIAPKSRTGQPLTRFVPNNDGDVKPDRQDRLTAKPAIPTLMLLSPGEKPEVQYLWNTEGMTDVPYDCLRRAARGLTALGLGVDMAFGDAKLVAMDEVQKLPGIRWYPKPGAWQDQGMLRVPAADPVLQESTLRDLMHCHESAVSRIEHGKPLHTVEKPRVFARVFYASVQHVLGRPSRIFELRNADGSWFRYSHRRLVHVAGMVRHLAIEAMKKDSPRDVGADWVETYVAGHVKAGNGEHRQLSYIPLPSVGREHTDPSVRRVMLVAPVGDDEWLDHVARRLTGQMLKPLRGDEFPKVDPPMLVPVRNDKIARFYTQPACVWHSFTPIILPGHDDHKPDKTRRLIAKALAQSGVDQPCEFEWSAFSRFAKAFSAHKYGKDGQLQGYIRPDHLQTQTAVHLTIRFHDGSEKKHPVSIPGPLTIGAGRHCGLGLLAAMDSA